MRVGFDLQTTMNCRSETDDFGSDEELIKYGWEEDVWHVTILNIYETHVLTFVQGMNSIFNTRQELHILTTSTSST